MKIYIFYSISFAAWPLALSATNARAAPDDNSLDFRTFIKGVENGSDAVDYLPACIFLPCDAIGISCYW